MRLLPLSCTFVSFVNNGVWKHGGFGDLRRLVLFLFRFLRTFIGFVFRAFEWSPAWHRSLPVCRCCVRGHSAQHRIRQCYRRWRKYVFIHICAKRCICTVVPVKQKWTLKFYSVICLTHGYLDILDSGDKETGNIYICSPDPNLHLGKHAYLPLTTTAVRCNPNATWLLH